MQQIGLKNVLAIKASEEIAKISDYMVMEKTWWRKQTICHVSRHSKAMRTVLCVHVAIHLQWDAWR